MICGNIIGIVRERNRPFNYFLRSGRIVPPGPLLGGLWLSLIGFVTGFLVGAFDGFFGFVIVIFLMIAQSISEMKGLRNL